MLLLVVKAQQCSTHANHSTLDLQSKEKHTEFWVGETKTQMSTGASKGFAGDETIGDVYVGTS